MNDKKEIANLKLSTHNLGAAAKTRARHARETLAILGKTQNLSRETFRRVEKVDKEAPAVLKEAMGKTVSIHKAFEINKYLQQMPEEEREVLAVWLISKAVEEKQSGAWRERVIANKLSDIMSIAHRNKKLITDESVDIYLKYNNIAITDAIDIIDDEIYWLYVLKKIFQNRKTKEKDK